MGILQKLEELLQGKKTFIVAIVIGIIAGLQAYGIVIPEYVWGLLGALGLGAIKSAINKSTPK